MAKRPPPRPAIDPLSVVTVEDPDTPGPTLLALNGQSPYGDLPEPWDCPCGTPAWTARWTDGTMSTLERHPDGSGRRGIWRLRPHTCAGPTQRQTRRAPTPARASAEPGRSWSDALYDRGG